MGPALWMVLGVLVMWCWAGRAQCVAMMRVLSVPGFQPGGEACGRPPACFCCHLPTHASTHTPTPLLSQLVELKDEEASAIPAGKTYADVYR